MLLDLLGAIALTSASAVVVGTLAWSLPWPSRDRARAAIVLFLWFAIVAALGATGALTATGAGPIGVGIAVALPLVVFAVALLHPRLLAPAVASIPLQRLVAIHAVRILGAFFVLLYAAGRLPAPFAPFAGWGDVIVGITALPVAWLVATRARGWRPVTLLWNVFGALDLADAILLGVTSSPGAPFRLFFGEPDTTIMSGLPWILIPAYLVPLLALTHVAIFVRLARARPAPLPAHA
ncbi:MAG TPA: hypothetical protein VF059_08165 [Casimicrobiaceae bacterium]